MAGILGGNECRNITFPYREYTHIINTVHVVSMCMCKPDCINVCDLIRSELKAELRWCINKKMSPIDLQNRTMAGPSVPRIIRGACITVTPNNRYSE